MYSAAIKRRKKYSSLFVSSLIHGCMLFAAFFVRYQPSDQFMTIPRTPAQVRWSNPAPVAPQQIQPSVASSHVQPNVPSETQQGLEGESADKLELESPAEEVFHNPIGQIPSPSPSRNGLSKASFMKSFMHAAQEVRQESQRGASRTEISPQEAFIAKEQKMWSEHHYKQRIIEAIGQASRFRSRSIHYRESINQVSQLTVPILKDGSLGDLSQYPFTSIPEVDRYIHDILKSADFPPIPKRFNTDLFLFSIPINVSIQKGSNVYYLSVR